LTADSEQIKTVFAKTGIVKQILRIATNCEDDKPNCTGNANIEAFKILINLTEHDLIVQELVILNAPTRLTEFITKLYKKYPVAGKSSIDDNSLESAIVVLANITRFYIGMESLLQLEKPAELQGFHFMKLLEIYLISPTDKRLDYLSAAIANCCPKPEARKILFTNKGDAMNVLIKNLDGPSPIRIIYTLIMLENIFIAGNEYAEWVKSSKIYAKILYAYILICKGARDASFVSYWLQKIVEMPILPEIEDFYKKLSEEHQKNISKHAIEAATNMAVHEEIRKEMEKNSTSSVISVLIEKTDSKELTDALLLLNSKLVAEDK